MSALLQSQIERLPTEAREVLDLLAVCGAHIDHALLERLMPVTACCAASRIYEQRAWSSKTSSTVGSATAPRMSCSARWPTTCYR